MLWVGFLGEIIKANKRGKAGRVIQAQKISESESPL
jgi:hypothetical protein